MEPRFIAILEDHPERAAAMRRVLADLLPAFNVILFDSVSPMIRWFGHSLSHTVLISLDHDLVTHDGTEPGDGRQIANYLATFQCICPVIVHTSNLQAAPGMIRVLREAGWFCAFVQPRDGFKWIAKEWRDEIDECYRRGWIFE